MRCPVCKIEMFLEKRDEKGEAVYACRNPQCQRFQKKKEAGS